MVPRPRIKDIQSVSLVIVAAVVLGFGSLGKAQESKPEDRHNSGSHAIVKVPVADNQFKMPRYWQMVMPHLEKHIHNDSGVDFGDFEDLIIDPNSGRILYGLLEPREGSKLYAVPWECFRGGDDSFSVNITKAQLNHATGFRPRRWPDFADDQWVASTYSNFDQTPFWQRPERSEEQKSDAASGESHERSAEMYRARWNRKPRAWERAIDLCGKNAVDANGNEIGRVTDLILDAENSRVLYAVLSYRNKLFAIPWPALSLENDAVHFTLNVNKDRLDDSVSFDEGSWPNPTDPKWASDIHTHFKVEPYWSTASVGH